MGIGNATVRNWKVSSPTVDKLKQVAYYFGVTLDALLQKPPLQNEKETNSAKVVQMKTDNKRG